MPILRTASHRDGKLIGIISHVDCDMTSRFMPHLYLICMSHVLCPSSNRKVSGLKPTLFAVQTSNAQLSWYLSA
jgi:hypothetical protein